MRKNRLRVFALGLATLLLAHGVVALAADDFLNVAGTWNVSVSGAAGSAQQTIVLQQDGTKISGTFKGPRQSGPLEGMVDGKNITFHVKTHVPFDYKGTIDGDTMKGTMTGKGKTGDWTATRTK